METFLFNFSLFSLIFLFNCTDAPKNINATVSSLDVNEGQDLTFSCFARGRPKPTFEWFHNGLQLSTQAEWVTRSITYSQAGSYSCTAQNIHGKANSLPMQVNVFCKSVNVESL